ncbi:DNA topoisomerase III [Pseudoalteromonas tunicata]|jgi:DNA topoisomerase-3|uniref:DNA topoisomerase 3 n=1 Tax=Pseudoalteromonas tunicata D2 TaxID=87626 RepID=A4C9G6_9GAMM|nr:DNA topoisomerase III [Pseudoalteromonas tunicata]ATC93735.1 DNA topoisomerase III [Pseudoalteromonas tunicata]AXT29560.1 DNA topoisomerase III [Pseudoalteromonas tunicata]EAR29231.1 DNA topoisomerase III [Pseudoalteromonas tunicata D2]MDP5211939.1 DNA topoisomerase III [Pseudoalteromonas tunicata]
MKLYIAEKPSLGRAIADVLPKPHQKGDGFIKAANGDVVSWCIGHLLEQAEPDHYNPLFKKWDAHHLPIVPQKWQLIVKPKTRKQFTVLKKLIKQADILVNAGDPDREGQLLVDEVIEFAGASESKKSQTQRLLISDLNPSAVLKALQKLAANHDFIPLSVSALARSRADWLFGMNLTRAYTLAGQKAGCHRVLSVGRVQTPILGLVVRRDLEIAHFVSKPFYEVLAHLLTDKQEAFSVKWQPSEACLPYQDEDGRVLVKALAENVVKRITGKPALVTKLQQQQKRQHPPLPYNLSALQIDAAKAFGMSAQTVLDVCQNLYEKHKAITYPRSDNRFLPNEHWLEAKQVLAAIAQNKGQDNKLVIEANLALRSKCWNDAKVEAHHAIIPTAKKLPINSLDKDELKIYQLISRHYLAQFYPAYVFNETKVEVEISGGKFNTTAKQELELGFKVLMGKDELQAEQILPPLIEGQQLLCENGELVEKMTQPPAHFNDATLLSAMTGISRYVSDIEIKKILKDTDGLGTEATRAGIIELLFRRGFLVREGKKIKSTETGKALIKMLPDIITRPDLTALWEASLADIAHKKQSYQHFMQPLITQLHELIDLAKSCDHSLFSNLPAQPVKKRFNRKRKSTAKK